MLFAAGGQSIASSVDEARESLQQGEFDQCVSLCERGIRARLDIEDFVCLKAEAEFQTGRYEAAIKTLENGLLFVPNSIRIRWDIAHVAPFAGKTGEPQKRLAECRRLIEVGSWRYSQQPNDLVTLALVVLHDGADPKQIQSVLLKRARDLHPGRREPILAMARLALEKRDMTLAGELFRKGLEQFPDDTDFIFGLACANEEVDPEESRRLIDATLKRNPRHAGALLKQAEHSINGERYQPARDTLKKILAVSEKHPLALATLSALSFLDEDLKESKNLREQALSTWKENPEVDYQIGKILSRNYRFQDGAAAQRRALAFRVDYLPAMRQLAQDLLRMGQEEEGWQLARTVYERDQYDVASYNLITLHDELENYTILERPGLRVRMEKREAEIYGEQVLNLLTQAKTELCAKYQIELPRTVSIEIFPDPSDFAVRTFGMPGAGGYLGVCFGDVVTALSPAAKDARPVNWESVLWHEFAHVVTLNKTHNRMPRWLSEGISVYEERQRDPRWGERMTPAYRDCILEGKMTPISRMSEAFLPPGSPCGLMFAYFQSSLVVEYLIDTYGQEALIAILDDLGLGLPINEAIERHTAPMKQLEAEFSSAMRVKALYYGWYVDWSPVKFERIAASQNPVEALLTWADRNPRNYNGLKAGGMMLQRLGKKEDAQRLLEQAIAVFPLETGPESAAAQLAALQRELGNPAERETLLAWTSIDDDAAAGLMRLIEIDTAGKDWAAVKQYSQRLLEIRPLIPQPYQALATAAEEQGNGAVATGALRTALKFSSGDQAGLHYRLARQLQKSGDWTDSRHHVLRSLEVAPRYREALQLLVELKGQRDSATDGSSLQPAPVTTEPSN